MSTVSNLRYRTFDLFRRTWVPQIKYYLGSADGAVGCPSLYNDILYVAEPNVTPPPDVFKVSVANGGVVPDSAINLGPDDILDSVFGEYKKALKENFEEGFKKLMGKDKYTTREYLRTQT